MNKIIKNGLKFIEHDIADVELLYNIFNEKNIFVGCLIVKQSTIKKNMEMIITSDCLKNGYPDLILNSFIDKLANGIMVWTNEEIKLEDFKYVRKHSIEEIYLYEYRKEENNEKDC